MLFFNEDWMHYICTRYTDGTDVNEKELREFIYQYKDTQITDFAMNVNGTLSTAPSKVFNTFADKYLAKEENGVAVDYSDTFAKLAYELIHVKRIDMYSIWIDALKEIGINPWLSIRTNDCHGNTEKTDLRKSPYIDSQGDIYISSHRYVTGYFDKCLDYTHPDVREKMLAYIDEMLGRYDVHGLELDMMREQFWTRPGFEVPSGIVKKVITEICKIKLKYEKKYGHKIKLSLLLPTSPNLCIERGINILDFAKEIDYITIIPRWETINTDMPIEVWKQILHGTDIKLGGGHQMLFAPYRGYLDSKPIISSVGIAFGQAAANLSRGCDFVYLYNYMDKTESESISDIVYKECIRNTEKQRHLFSNIGSLDTLMMQQRSHVLTYSDTANYDLSVSSKLPMSFNAKSPFEIVKIPVGKVPANAKVKLILGIDAVNTLQPDNFEVYVNSAKCRFDKVSKINENICADDCYFFDITENLFDIMYAEININTECTLEYVEISVEP